MTRLKFSLVMKLTVNNDFFCTFSVQVKKTWGATLATLQDMTVLDDCDVSQSFTHSPSSESVKSSVSDGYLNKPSLAKRRANQQETELFYFNVSELLGFIFKLLKIQTFLSTFIMIII